MNGRQESPVARRLFRLAQALFVLNAVIWLALGAVSLNRLAGSAGTLTLRVVATLMLGNAAALLLCAWLLRRPGSLVLPATTAVLAINILLTFTDQVGILDVATAVLDVVLLGIVLAAFRAAR